MTTNSIKHKSIDQHIDPGHRRRWAALFVLMLPVLLISVDNTVLSFAVPALTEALLPTGPQLLWIIDIYPLILAGLLVPMGSLGDRFGRRRMLLIGSTGFALVSAAAAFASSAEQLIAARALLGVFGAMLMPATLSLIRNIFTEANERRKAIAVWAAAFSGGAALGPIVGGYLLEHFWWGSVFLMAVPVLFPLLILGPTLIPESKDPKPAPIDPMSIVLAISTLLPIVYGIKEATTADSLLIPIAAILVGLVSGMAFTFRQLRRKNPMLDVRLFKNPIFSGALAVNLLSIFAFVGFIYFLSQHLQLVAGYSPIDAGLLMLPGLAMTVTFGFLAVPLVRRFKTVTVVVAGLAMNAAAYGIVAFFGQSGSVPALMVAFCVLGAGVGMSETLSNDLALGAVPASKAGAASAISETAYEIGSVMGIAVLGSILNAVFAKNLLIPAGLTGQQATDAAQTLGGAHLVASQLPGTKADTAAALLDSAAHAFDTGVMITSIIAVVLTVLAAFIVFCAMRGYSGDVTKKADSTH
ncbi:MFS transporter [Paeniglutamicibacter cryotolerans]|uniref:DHA2 family multidrug resistance protein-like MFS transporter n=1 Tax=Paeniglutamicibacter cryotolerans TaxID=670079 RepID=A0A839QE06_9MICC|nr:MFS transporter [Paeniglutamicibacter cryotolerans]MBB2994468.1 DHA2 family multidrug resistance protein-like MFS transporter [Paeniglutamicibacter cryotolerans]